MCGICGVYNVDNAAGTLVNALFSLKHRGQNGAGIVTLSDTGLDVRKGNGQFVEVSRRREFETMKGRTGIGHVRYPTTGEHDIFTLEASSQPEFIGTPCSIAMSHNGQITNIPESRRMLEENGIGFESNVQIGSEVRRIESQCDVKYLLGALSIALGKNTQPSNDDIFHAVHTVMEKIQGAYSAVALLGDSKNPKMLAFADPYRIRPAVVGRRGDSFMVSSESCAFGYGGLGFKKEFDIGPGEAVIIDQNGIQRRTILRKGFSPCMFEFIYFASPESVIDGVPVSEIRYMCGEQLGATEQHDFDTVVYVPESGAHHAEGFMNGLKSQGKYPELRRGFVRRGVRTFIEPKKETRHESVRKKLTPIEHIFRGRRVVIYDDSLIRGTTSSVYVQLARDSGATEVHVRASIVPHHPCYHGIDFTSRNELVLAQFGYSDMDESSRHEVHEERIRQYIRADSFRFIPAHEIGNIISAAYERFSVIQMQPDIGCLNGSYPTSDVSRFHGTRASRPYETQ